MIYGYMCFFLIYTMKVKICFNNEDYGKRMQKLFIIYE